ncbi:MAG: RNA polymerase sigma factor [Actinomycetota bacterium]
MSAVPERSFEIEWPILARRLDFLLARKCPSVADREDIIQETGLRLLGMWSRVDLHRSAAPLATAIALNLLRDRARRPVREVLGHIPESAAVDDVERSGMARVDLTVVSRSLDRLPDRYRVALLAEVDPDHHPRPHKMVRWRARRALKSMLERKALGISAGLLRARRGFEIAQGLAGGRAGLGAGAASLVIFSVLAPFSSLAPDANARVERDALAHVRTDALAGAPSAAAPASADEEVRVVRRMITGQMAKHDEDARVERRSTRTRDAAATTDLAPTPAVPLPGAPEVEIGPGEGGGVEPPDVPAGPPLPAVPVPPVPAPAPKVPRSEPVPSGLVPDGDDLATAL